MSETMTATRSLAERHLPLFDCSDEQMVLVEADAATTWGALMDADLIEAGRRTPLAGALGAVRVLPEVVVSVLRGRCPPKPPDRVRLRDTAEVPPEDGGWVLLSEIPGEAIALGMVGRFWQPVIRYAPVPAGAYDGFAEPGWAKTLYALSVQPLGEGRCALRAVMRTATTDARARRRFRRYWTLGVGSGARVVVGALLDMVREEAERRALA